MAGKKRGHRTYATDLTDEQWALIAPMIPDANRAGVRARLPGVSW